MSTIEVKFRKGLPTKKSLNQLLELQFKSNYYKVRVMTYVKNMIILVWSDNFVNEQIESFASLLQEHGIKTGQLRLYESPRNGSLHILNNEKVK